MARQAVVVLGMHRSGTSAVAGALGLTGLRLPTASLPPQPDNPRGFFEPQSVVAMNDRALALCGTTWFGIGAIPSERLAGPASESLVEELARTLVEEFPPPGTLVLKEPRICRLMPLWSRALAKAGMDIRVVLPLRNPFEVAGSLKTRNGFPVDFGLALWLRHVLDAEHASRGTRRVFVRYADLVTEPAATVHRIGQAILDDWKTLSSEAAAAVAGFVDPGLNNEVARAKRRQKAPSAFLPWLAETEAAHEDLLRNPDDEAACRRLDVVRQAFDSESGRFASLVTEMAATINTLFSKLPAGDPKSEHWQKSLSRHVRDRLRRLFEPGNG